MAATTKDGCCAADGDIYRYNGYENNDANNYETDEKHYW